MNVIATTMKKGLVGCMQEANEHHQENALSMMPV